MHPDQALAIAQTHRHEMQRYAEVGRRAADFKQAKHRRVQVNLPRIEFGRRAAAARAKLAHA